jgi:hypothetical protein
MADTPAGRITIARLRHRPPPRLPEPAPGQHRAALAELTRIAASPADLLAEVAGIEAGAHDRDMDQAMRLRAAPLCAEAGTDPTQIPRWAAERHRRAAALQAYLHA